MLFCSINYLPPPLVASPPLELPVQRLPGDYGGAVIDAHPAAAAWGHVDDGGPVVQVLLPQGEPSVAPGRVQGVHLVTLKLHGLCAIMENREMWACIYTGTVEQGSIVHMYYR